MQLNRWLRVEAFHPFLFHQITQEKVPRCTACKNSVHAAVSLLWQVKVEIIPHAFPEDAIFHVAPPEQFQKVPSIQCWKADLAADGRNSMFLERLHAPYMHSGRELGHLYPSLAQSMTLSAVWRNCVAGCTVSNIRGHRDCRTYSSIS